MWSSLNCLALTLIAQTTEPDPFFQFYASNIRGSAFTGFLTLTGFLFAAKTFIVITMKKEVYEDPEYRKRVASMRSVNPKLKTYAPLQRLSNFLFVAVLSTLIASVSQLTIGLWASKWSAIVCMSLAGLAILFVVVVLILIRLNLSHLFKNLEDKT